MTSTEGRNRERDPDDPWSGLVERVGARPIDAPEEVPDPSGPEPAAERGRPVGRPWVRIAACLALAFIASSCVAVLVTSQGADHRPARRTIDDRRSSRPRPAPRPRREHAFRRHRAHRRVGGRSHAPKQTGAAPAPEPAEPALSEAPPEVVESMGQPPENPPAPESGVDAPPGASPAGGGGLADGARSSAEFGL